MSTLSPAASLKCISKQLKQSAHFSNISRTLQPNTQTPLSKVHITTTTTADNPETGAPEMTTHVQVIDAQAELEAAILERIQRHFAQAEGTPYTLTPLKDMTADNALSTYYDTHGQPIDLPWVPSPRRRQF
jgi:hypothetical protein